MNISTIAKIAIPAAIGAGAFALTEHHAEHAAVKGDNDLYLGMVGGAMLAPALLSGFVKFGVDNPSIRLGMTLAGVGLIGGQWLGDTRHH